MSKSKLFQNYNNVTYLFLSFLVIIFIYSCANQLPPSGGGVDLTSPIITRVYPKNGTINFKDDYAEISFSKYVDKRSVQDAIFISPAIEGLEYDWSGKDVRLNFTNKLKDSTTYVITVGTDVVDLNNHNKMASAYTFSFSTGDKIDRGEVSGKVYSDKPEGILIFAYNLDESNANPYKIKPDYISQSGKDGGFKLLGLANGNYRVFAVDDKYRDFIFQSNQDMIGMPSSDVKITNRDSVYNNIDFFLTKVDTTKPRLISASMTDRNHILLNFSTQVDTSVIHNSNFSIVDSSDRKKLTPLYAFKGNTKPTESILVTNEDIPKGSNIYVFAKEIKDLDGNIYNNDYSSLNVTDRPDTTKPSIFKTIPNQNSNSVDFTDPQIIIYFNDAFNKSLVDGGIALTDTSKNVLPSRIHFLDDATMQVIPKVPLEANKYYLISVDLSKFQDVAGNKFDTTFVLKFKTINGLDFTGVSGKILNIDTTSHPIMILQNTEQKETKYQEQLKTNNFSFDRVQPGKYMLWCFLDKNQDKKYSYGWPFPYKPSEKFSFYPDTLNLKARWVITDVSFNFK